MINEELKDKLYKLAEEAWPNPLGSTEEDKVVFIHGFVMGYSKSRLAILDISIKDIREAALDYDNKATYEPPHTHFTEGIVWHMEQIRTKY